MAEVKFIAGVPFGMQTEQVGQLNSPAEMPKVGPVGEGMAQQAAQQPPQQPDVFAAKQASADRLFTESQTTEQAQPQGFSIGQAVGSGLAIGLLTALGGKGEAARRFLMGSAVGVGSSALNQYTTETLQTKYGLSPEWANMIGFGVESTASAVALRPVTRAYVNYDEQINLQKAADIRLGLLEGRVPGSLTKNTKGEPQITNMSAEDLAWEYTRSHELKKSVPTERGVGRTKLAMEELISAPDTWLEQLGPIGNDIRLMAYSHNIDNRMFVGKLGSQVKDIQARNNISNSSEGINNQRAVGLLMSDFHGKMNNLGEISSEGLATVEKMLGRPATSNEINAASELATQFYKPVADWFLKSKAGYYEGGVYQEFTPLENYYPHYPSPEVQQKRFDLNESYQQTKTKLPGVPESILQKVMTSGKKTAPVAFTSWRGRQGINPAQVDYNAFDVALKYAKGSASHMANYENYGPNFTRLINAAEWASKVRGEDGILKVDEQINQLAKKYVEDVKMASYSTTEEAANLLKNVRALTTASSMWASALPNAAQLLNTFIHSDIGSFFKGIANFPERKAMATKAGTVISQEIDDYLSTLGAGGKSIPERMAAFTLKKGLFSATEINNRLASNAIGSIEAEKIAQDISLGKALPSKAREFSEAGINLELVRKTGQVTDEDKTRYAIYKEKQTQFGTRPHEVPMYWQTPLGKTIMQYKNFTYNNSKMFKNMIQDAWSDYRETGDIRAFDQMLKATIAFPITGSILLQVRDFLLGNDRKRSLPESIIEGLATVGTWGIALDFSRSIVEGPYRFATSMVMPPSVSKTVAIGHGVATGDVAGTAKAVTGSLGKMAVTAGKLGVAGGKAAYDVVAGQAEEPNQAGFEKVGK